MVLIVSNGIIPLENRCIYMNKDILVIESEISSRCVVSVPSDALAKIAVAFAENKNFIEFGDAALAIEEAEDEA